MNGTSLGIVQAEREMGYETRLFDNTKVHTIDIIMEDWEAFLETCADEEYVSCNVVIDGETYQNVGIRAKGNTSLSSVEAYGNDRYSFKIEFDKYSDVNTYYGLDKISLNNIIQDNTYLKDYLSYTMMNDIGIAAPLCSFTFITVNGEDWGLYLAVEGVEEGFLQRNYGTDYGELYKPDSMNIGGAGAPEQEMDFNFRGFQGDTSNFNPDSRQEGMFSATSADADFVGNQENVSGMPEIPEMPENMAGMMPGNGQTMPEEMPEDMQRMPQENGNMPSDSFTFGEMGETGSTPSQAFQMPSQGGGFEGFGMGSEDVKLQYIDDNPESYSNIFDNAKTNVTKSDQERLISSLKTLSEGENIEDVVDIEAVIKYFVVHNFVCNGDSYTGSMVHNYYLYEEDGVMSMIPWDYNLAFGGFSMGGGFGTNLSGATSEVNSPIDSPVSGEDISSRPMVAWIFENESYTELYHQYYKQFISEYFESGYFEEMIEQVTEMISPYVEKDPTAFCSYEEFEKGVDTLKQFCLLRAESISGQLDGTIPSTSEGQSEDSSSLIDASNISLSDMGSMGGGMGGERRSFGNSENIEEISSPKPESEALPSEQETQAADQRQTDLTEETDETDETQTDGHIQRKNETPDNAQSDRSSEFVPSFGENMNLQGDSQDSQIILLGISSVILVLGIVFAIKFRYR